MNLIEPSNIKDNALSPKPCDTFLNRESIHPRAESTFSQLLQIEQSNNAFLRSYFGHRWSDTMGPGADHAQIIGHFYESITPENGSVTASTTFQHLSLPLLFSNNHSFSLFHSPAIHLVNTIPLSLSLSRSSLSLFFARRYQTTSNADEANVEKERKRGREACV